MREIRAFCFSVDTKTAKENTSVAYQISPRLVDRHSRGSSGHGYVVISNHVRLTSRSTTDIL
jgi:hypothetical protein